MWFFFPLRMWVKGTCWTWLCDRLLSFEFLFVDPPWGSTSGGQLFTYNPTDLVNIKCLERLKEGEGDDREMVGWHHRFDGVEFGQTPGVGDGRGSLACPSLWASQRVGHDWGLNWTQLLDLLLQKMTTGWQHCFCFKLHSSISVPSLFYFRVGLISDTVTGTGAWFSDTPPSVISFLGSFSPDRGLQCLQEAALCYSTVFSWFSVWRILMSFPCKLFIYPTFLTLFC